MAVFFVVISGLPGSGKSTLARQLAPALGLPVLDKDDILERLFDQKGTGNREWRRSLSRESDAILQQEAATSEGAVLVSHWRMAGMAEASGTPIDWLPSLAAPIVHLHCVCPPVEAARRFRQRARHAGHLDNPDSADSILQLASLAPPDLGPRIDVDTTAGTGLDALVAEILRLVAQAPIVGFDRAQ